MQCWGRRLLTTAAHVTSVAMAHGRVAEERDSEYRAARPHEGALCRLVRFTSGLGVGLGLGLGLGSGSGSALGLRLGLGLELGLGQGRIVRVPS